MRAQPYCASTFREEELARATCRSVRTPSSLMTSTPERPAAERRRSAGNAIGHTVGLAEVLLATIVGA